MTCRFGTKGSADAVYLGGGDGHFESTVTTGKGAQGEKRAVVSSRTEGEDANFVIEWRRFGGKAGGVVWRGCWSLGQGMQAERGTGGSVGTWGGRVLERETETGGRGVEGGEGERSGEGESGQRHCFVLKVVDRECLEQSVRGEEVVCHFVERGFFLARFLFLKDKME